MTFTNASVATIHADTVPALRSIAEDGVTARTINARLSSSSAAAVLGAIGMNHAGGCTKTDQLTAQPMSTRTLFAATSAASASAAPCRNRFTARSLHRGAAARRP